MKAQHEQVEVDRSQTLTEFIKEDQVNLKDDVHYNLSETCHESSCLFSG
jgi:hypothetical protein